MKAIAIDVEKELVRILVINRKLVIPTDQHRIYHYSPDGPNNPTSLPPTPGRPNELVWLVWGLPQGWRVMIEAKPQFQGLGYMPQDVYTIALDANPVPSGVTLRGPGPTDPPEWWIYDIKLLDGSGHVIDSYDPEVIIDKDP